jgi:segregation and condensation protein A
MAEGVDRERYIVQLDVFEGPLDLLLHLISKHEIDIFDIPIAFITRKYLEYLDMMKSLNLDLAAEYLEMAATLALIKSKMLVPGDPAGDEEEVETGLDPREELVRRLLEYQKYKTAAEDLMARPMLGRDTFSRGMAEEISMERDIASPGLFALIAAFQEIAVKAHVDSSHQVMIVRMSITDRIHQIVDILRQKKRLTFTELFEGQHTRSDLVVSFISLLEMSKLGLVRIHQAGYVGEIYISATSNIFDSLEHLAESLEEE